MLSLIIDAHGLKIRGGGGSLSFCQNTWAGEREGAQGFQEKLPLGSPYFRFYCIFINCFIPPTPLCASMNLIPKENKIIFQNLFYK
jgi:hypothetical protein